MPTINGLTNPFENSILNSNLTQLEKDKQISDYAAAMEQGYEPPAEVLAEIAALLEAGVLSPEALERMQTLTDQIMAEIGPIIVGGDTASITINENTSVVTTVTALDRYSLNDGTETLSYSIVGGNDSALFEIDEMTGELRFIAPPDYEAPVGGDNIYDVIVQVNDGAVLMDTQAIKVTVVDLNDTAPVITSAAAVTIDENTTAIMTVTSDDPDTVGSKSYSIIGGADEFVFAINTSTGALSFSNAPDFEAKNDADGDNIYDVTVRVSDGIQTDTQDIQVTVADLNDTAPVITSAAAVTIDENTTAIMTVTSDDPDTVGSKSYSIIGGADAGAFAIDTSTGALSFSNAPDFEAKNDADGDNIYDVTVQVSDGIQTDTQDIQVNVQNTQVRIAVVYQAAGDADAVVAQLNDTTVYDFVATKVHYTDADSIAELSQYDVVIHAGDLTEAFSLDYWEALRNYVQTNEGGVVTTGWMGAAMRSFAPLGESLEAADYVTPIANAGYFYSFGDINPNTGHPVTNGLQTLTTPLNDQHFETANAIDAGSIDWSDGFNSIVTKEVAGEGNTVYLGGHYTESTYSEGTLRTGAWDQLLEQSVYWAAQEDAFIL